MDDGWIPWHKRSPENAEAFRKTQREARQRRTQREPDKVYEQRERSREKHKERHSAYLKEWQRDWYQAHKEELRPVRIARVRANDLKRSGRRSMISWQFTKEIAEFYAEARRRTVETGVQHVVDHYWPINGKVSCGLHVPWNLRVITSAENDAKGNREPENHWS